MSGFIYKATSKTSGKVYIGQTTRTLCARIAEHKYKSQCNENLHFYCAIRKYGFDDFEWEIIEDNIPEEQMDAAETKYIASFNSFECGYNSTEGGEHGNRKPRTEETRAKIRAARLGKKHSEATITKMKNKIVSAPTKEKHRQAQLGKPHSKETKEKIAATLRNRSPAQGKYKGASFIKSRNSWLASIRIDGQKITLGWFNTAEEAAFAYNKKAQELFGENCYLNTIPNK